VRVRVRDRLLGWLASAPGSCSAPWDGLTESPAGLCTVAAVPIWRHHRIGRRPEASDLAPAGLTAREGTEHDQADSY
jgi:hypothetical protein